MADTENDVHDIMAGLDFSDLDENLLSPEEPDVADLDRLGKAEIQANFDDPDAYDHSPKALDDVDLGAYDIVDVGQRADSTNYIHRMLLETRKEFESVGRGDYECILRWSHNRVDSEDVERFIKAVRSRVSQMRAKIAMRYRGFVVCKLEYLILEDRKHVALSMSRMTTAKYNEYQAEMYAARSRANSTVDELAQLLIPSGEENGLD